MVLLSLSTRPIKPRSVITLPAPSVHCPCGSASLYMSIYWLIEVPHHSTCRSIGWLRFRITKHFDRLVDWGPASLNILIDWLIEVPHRSTCWSIGWLRFRITLHVDWLIDWYCFTPLEHSLLRVCITELSLFELWSCLGLNANLFKFKMLNVLFKTLHIVLNIISCLIPSEDPLIVRGDLIKTILRMNMQKSRSCITGSVAR